MKKIFYFIPLLLLIAWIITFAVKKHPQVYSAGLDYDNACDFKESFAVSAGDTVYFHSDLDVGDMITIETTVANPDAKKFTDDKLHKKYYWHFVNHNRKKFKREYSKIFTTKIRIGAKPGWFEFKYKHFDIAKGNTASFHIIDTSHCRDAKKSSDS